MAASITRRAIRAPSDQAPPPGGPFSQAIVEGHTMLMSGQVGKSPLTKKIVEGGIEPETKQVLENMTAVLKAAGADLSNVVKTTVLMDDLADFNKMNAVYESYFKGPMKPARACYQAAKLPLGCKIEIKAVAILGDIEDIQ